MDVPLRSRKDKQHDHPLFAVVSFLNVIQKKLELLPATTRTPLAIESTPSLQAYFQLHPLRP